MSPVLSSAAIREAVHLLILQELAGVRGGDMATLKGGVNLRLFFQSARYSEDIDLDGTAEASSAIRGCLQNIFRDRAFLQRLRRLGIRGLDPGEGPNKDTATTFRYKFGVIGPGDIRYPTKIEVSFRAVHPADMVMLEPPGEQLLRRYGLRPIPVRHYERRSAVRQKLDALGGRREVQARDVFDLHLLGATHPDAALLAHLATGLSQARLEDAYQRVFEISYQEYRGQVLEFLEADARERYDTEGAWDEIRLGAAALIERVLEHRRDR